MKRFLLVAMLVSAGCGDNSKDCGPGTKDVNGTCTAVSSCGAGTTPDPATGQCVPDGSMICTDGTVFDPVTSTCKPDPSLCQDGTVLVGGQCVIPGTVDIEEAPEPNGLGLLGETSNNPAGVIALKPVGEHFVLHGTINPWQDADGDGLNDPDIDAYVVTVTGPSLLHVTADGVHGLAAGFVAIAAVDQSSPLINWVRFGINLTADTSDRQLFLPAAGTYIIAISDTRSLFLQGGAAGNAMAQYYVTVDALDLPAPTPLTGNTVSGTIGGEVQFYAPAMGTGINDVLLDMPQAQANASVVTLANTTFKGFADEGTDLFGNPTPAEMVAGGFTSSDSALVVVDDTYNYAIGPAQFTLTVTTSDATPLSTTGGTVSQTEATNTQPGTLADVPLLDQFYFDTTAPDQTVGLAITWNHPVRGSLLDGDLNFIAEFTTYGSSDPTWTTYTGLLRLQKPGRYYFFVYDPAGTAGTTQLSATSTIAMITPAAITEGTPTGNVTLSPFKANAFTYDAGTTDPWQLFNATGVNTGGQIVGWYDPATTYGRLDRLTASSGAVPAEATPLFFHQYTAAGGPIGRIVLDDPTTNYFVKVNAVAPAGTATFDLSFDKRTIIDLGTLHAGDTGSAANNPLGGGTTTGYVLFRSDPGAPATITVHPHVATLNTRFTLVNADESAAGAAINTSNTGDDTTSLLPGKPWTAFLVTAQVTPPVAQQYDVTVAVAQPKTYVESTSSTTFANVCGTAGAVNIAFTADGTGNGPANDEGLSAAIATPAGFQFYGVAAPSLRVSTNGWLTLAGIPSDAAFANASIPDPAAPNGIVAPYWDDLASVTACRKLTGTRLTIQWDGVLFGTTTAVHVQAILDASTNTIELVYATNTAALGDSATIGVEDQAGAHATQHSFNTAGAIAPGDARLYTPM
jgi:hypothetical protein